MVTLIASTVLTLTPLAAPTLEFGQQPLVGKVKRASQVSQSAKAAQLQAASGTPKAIAWSPYLILGPDRTTNMGGSLIFWKPSSVAGTDACADLLGMPGGWNSQPGDQQSYLLAYFPIHTGKRYGLVYGIDRYTDDAPLATFTFEGSGPSATKSLTGAGNLYYSFVATSTGRGAVMLKMSSKGRYLFRRLEIKIANS